MSSPSKRALALCCLLASGMAYYYFTLFLPYSHAKLESAGLHRGYRYGCDLYPLWLTSRQILHDRDSPYSPKTTKQIQVGLYGRPLGRPGDPAINYRAFAYPLYADFLACPVAWLPFPLVQALGSVLFPLIVICTCWLWVRFLHFRFRRTSLVSILLLTLVSYPVLEGLYALQPSLIVAFLLAGTALAVARNHLILAGAVLALASVKPQLIGIVALWLLLWAATDFTRRRRFVFSFFATLLLLFAASEWAVPGWLKPWTHALADYRQYTDPPLSQFALGAIAGNLLAVGLLATAAVLAFRSRRAEATSPQFVITLSYLLAITVLIVPSSIAVYDHISLFPAILWLFSRKDEILKGSLPIRILGFAAAAAFAWQWIAAIGVVLYSLGSLEARQSVAVMLPLRMAASVPFAVVALWLFLMWKGKLSESSTLAKSAVRSG